MASSKKNDPLWNKAHASLTRYLRTRDHSEKELRQKLSQKYPENLVEEMIQLAHKSHLMSEPSELAQRTAERLFEKGKGSQYVTNYLSEKGLPPVSISDDEELQAARQVVEVKFGDLQNLRYDGKSKVQRFLQGRGFSEEIINRVIPNNY